MASRGVEAPGNIFSPAAGNGAIGVHIHAAAASPGDSTLALLPFFDGVAVDAAGESAAFTVAMISAVVIVPSRSVSPGRIRFQKLMV